MDITLSIQPYCTCVMAGRWKPQDGWVEDRPSGLWVHPRCHKPSRMNYERFVLKIEPIKEDRNTYFLKREVDIYAEELRYWALDIIESELDWGDDLD